MRIAYYGYDFFSNCMEAVLQQGHEIVALYTMLYDNIYNQNIQVLSFAKAHHIPVRFNKPSMQEMLNLKVDLHIVAAYPYKLPIVGDIYAINIHPSLLPIGAGPWPLPHVILKDHKESGVTIHKLNEVFDAGEILSQARIKIAPFETLESLSFKSQLLAKDLLLKVLADFYQIWAIASPQDLSKREFWSHPLLEDRTIDWNNSIECIHRQVRAFGKFASSSKFDGHEWLISDIDCWKCEHHYPIGHVVRKCGHEILIAAIDGLVCLRHFSRAKAI